MRRPIAAITALAIAASLSVVSSGLAMAPSSFKPPPLFHMGPRKPPPSLAFAYDGFQVDASQAPKGVAPDKAIRQIKAQIDLVDHVGLKPEVIAFMRSTPIRADPAKPNAPGESAHYEPGRGVLVRISRLNPKKPILLEGMLEAYHAERIAPAAAADVTRFRSEADARHVWPKTAMMLQSDRSYFALTASAYLHGEITREPYSRANLRQTQPRYYRWLAMFFDDGRAR